MENSVKLTTTKSSPITGHPLHNVIIWTGHIFCAIFRFHQTHSFSVVVNPVHITSNLYIHNTNLWIWRKNPIFVSPTRWQWQQTSNGVEALWTPRYRERVCVYARKIIVRTARYRTRSALFTIIKTINSRRRHILYFYYFCCRQLICIVSHVPIINI